MQDGFLIAGASDWYEAVSFAKFTVVSISFCGGSAEALELAVLVDAVFSSASLPQATTKNKQRKLHHRINSNLLIK